MPQDKPPAAPAPAGVTVNLSPSLLELLYTAEARGDPIAGALAREVEGAQKQAAKRQTVDHLEKKLKKRRADVSVEYLKKHTRLFRSEDTAFVRFPRNGHHETAKVRSKRFRTWARLELRQADNGRSLSANQFEEVLQSIEDEALSTGIEAVVFLRIGKDNSGNILLDPGWAAWELIVVSREGWKIRRPGDAVTNGSPDFSNILFIRPEGFGQLPPLDDRPGDLRLLRRFVNLGTAAEFRLLLAYLVHCFFVDGPFLILVLIAEMGSAKSVTFRVIKRTIDPHAVELLAPPKEPRDVFAAASASWVIFWDNLSSVADWLSDTWCRLTNGAGTLEREYYTNAEPFFYHAKRPIGGNGITDVLHRGDALQRSLILSPPRIPAHRRIPEAAFWQAFDYAAPVIFRGLLDTLVGMLAELPEVHLEEHLRQADFCRIGTALERAMGWAPGSFMQAYTRNQRLGNQTVLEASGVASVLLRYLESQGDAVTRMTQSALTSDNALFSGTAADLLHTLESFEPEANKSRYWPTTPKALSDALRRLALNLTETGWQIEFKRTKKERHITISKGRESCVTTVHPSSQESHIEPGDFEQEIPF